MMLSDIQIMQRLVKDRHDPDGIFISPLIHPVAQLGSSSLDLHLGTEFRLPEVVDLPCIDLTGSDSDNIQTLIDEHFPVKRISPDKYIILHPGEFMLGHTLEYIKLPCNIAARLEGRSFVGRLGILVHATAGFVDPGFEGNLTLELVNAGKMPVKITPGFRLAQICFFDVADVQVPYNLKHKKKYHKSRGTVPSKFVT